jgi:hypothetical protein
VTKFDASGTRQWTRLLGTRWFEQALSVAADGSGQVYVAGATKGNLAGQTNTHEGFYDGFLASFEATGNRLWVRLFGTRVGDRAYGVVSAGSRAVYVAGWTEADLRGQTYQGGDADGFVLEFQ